MVRLNAWPLWICEAAQILLIDKGENGTHMVDPLQQPMAMGHVSSQFGDKMARPGAR